MIAKFPDRLKKTSGFTLVEALVAISVFMFVIAMATGLFSDSFASKRKTEMARTLYEETRIALERVVKEIRRGTIDYEEYWNRFEKVPSSTDGSGYGQNYGEYARQFYRESDGVTVPDPVTRLHENVGENDGLNPLRAASDISVCDDVPFIPDADGYKQCELYLITAEGDEKTIIKLIDDSGEYRLAMMKMAGTDIDADGAIDTWTPKTDYVGPVFREIQPNSIQITALEFHLAPLEDPRKAFAEFTGEVQQQPHILITLEATPTASRIRGIRGELPIIKLQTTVGARAQNEVKSVQ